MTKLNFKKFFVTLTLAFLMIFSIFSLSACGGGLGKEVDAEFAFGKIEAVDKTGTSTREKLLNSYEDYDYIELEVKYYNEKDYTLDRTEYIYVHNVYTEGKTDLLIYREVRLPDGVEISYSLLKEERTNSVLYESKKVGNELTKYDGELMGADTFTKELNAFFAEFYNASMLPQGQDDIIVAYKKTFSTDVNKMASLEITFDGLYNEEVSINTVSFNYKTNKIHFVKNYTEDMHLLREIEYTYSGNFATNVEEIDMNLFSKHVHTWVDATCLRPEHCSECETEKGERAEHILDERGICTVCYNGAEAIVDGVYYRSLFEAVSNAAENSTVTLLKDTVGEGLVIDKSITIDFGGFTYTVNKCVGSAGTETLGFQLLKDNTIVFKNGTIAAASVAEILEGKAVKMLVQNYANLKLENMILDGTGSEEMQYVLSNNSGDSFIKGTSKIKTPEGAVAFDVYNYSSAGYSLPTLTVDNTVEVIGKIEALGGSEGVEGGMKYYPQNYTKE